MSEERSPGITLARAMALNPSAGTHPVTADPREVAAASRAGDRSLEEFPYYLARYGDRGRLFALSDGAWIVTLCASQDTAAITAEVSWLTQVLSSRGMPSLLMEKHLEFMEAELTEAVPEKAAEYARLSVARRALEDLRRDILSDEQLRALASEFARSAEPDLVKSFPHMGELLVSAVVDEAAGIGRAVPALMEWVGDRARFPAQWVDAATRTIDAARQRVPGTPG